MSRAQAARHRPKTPHAGPNVAISQADGTYALFDLRYTGGPVTVAAIAGGTTRTATAYESNPQDTKSPGLRFARHLAPFGFAQGAPSNVEGRWRT